MKRNILIVTGSASAGRRNRDLLERAGYAVQELASLDDALGLARQRPPLAVVVQRPDNALRAERFAALLRGHPLTQSVPVLVLTPETDSGAGLGTALAAEEVAGLSWLPEHSPPRTLLDEIAYLTRPWRPLTPPPPVERRPEAL